MVNNMELESITTKKEKSEKVNGMKARESGGSLIIRTTKTIMTMNEREINCYLE